ncbi:MAG: hypothetical protein JL50_09235 [Peptococcaceae bacterium BICA1-7]|nr:MAG: hypothetical protein JL50_09235 [Peptococcaceae bacterium BICA1-7]HBV97245.1 spore gernimation protein [Desulfotomaculum sp.]
MKQCLISERELLFLVATFIIGTSIMLVPPAVASEAKQDAWLALLLGMLLSLLIANILISLQKKFPKQSLVEYSSIVLGFPIGQFISGIFLVFALQLSVFILRNIGDFVHALILPQTPLVAIQAIIMIIAVYAVRNGLEVFARVIIFMMLPSLLFFLFISIITLPYAEFSRLLPFMENGYKPVIRGAITAASFPFGEIIIFSMILPKINSFKPSGKGLLYGILIGFLFLELGIIRTISILGVESSIRHIYPVIEAVEEAPVSNMLVIILTLNWFAFAFAKLTICLYVLTTGVSQWLNINNPKILLMPFGVLITALSVYIYSNYIEEIYFASKINPYYKIPIGIGIPLFLWLVAKIRSSQVKS